MDILIITKEQFYQTSGVAICKADMVVVFDEKAMPVCFDIVKNRCGAEGKFTSQEFGILLSQQMATLS